MKIYLPRYAKDQLEQAYPEVNGKAMKWDAPIRYRENPSFNFPYELDMSLLDEEILEYQPLENGFLHPDRTEPDTIVELLEKVW